MADEAEAAAAAAKAAAEAAEAARLAAASASVTDDEDEDDLEDDEVGLNKVDLIAKRMIEAQGGTFRAGSPEAKVVKKLVHDTFKLRGKNTKLRERVVAEGDVIVRKGTEAEQYAAMKAIGLTPTEIKARLEQRDKFEKTIKANERKTFFSDVADGLGYQGRGKKAFIRMIEKEGIDLQVKEVEVEKDGRTSKEMKPFAKLPTESDDKLRPLDEYVEQELGDYLPAFQAEGSDDPNADDDSAERRPHAAAAKVTPMVSQSGSTRNASDKAKANSTVDSVMAKRYGQHTVRK